MKKFIWNLFTRFVDLISHTHTFHAHFSLLFTIGATLMATLLAYLYHLISPSGGTNIGLIYILMIMAMPVCLMQVLTIMQECSMGSVIFFSF